MAHNSDYSHIWAESNNGLTVSEIGAALGVASKSVGVLCSSDNIKIGAKFKPVKRDKTSALTDAERLAAWYGFSISGLVPTSAPYNLLTYYDGNYNGWQYAKPRGGSYGEWFRMLDFNHYITNPKNLLQTYNAATAVVYDSQTTSPFDAASFIGLTDSTGRSVELSDFAAMLGATNNLYFGIALFKGTNLTPSSAMSARTEIATSGSPLAKNSQGTYSGTVVQFTKTNIRGNLDKGIWTVVPFLCVGAISQCGSWEGTSLPIKVYYPLPFASITQIDFQSYQDSYTITFDGTKTAVYLNAEIKFINQSSAARTLTVSAFFWDSSVAGTPDTRARQSYELQFDKTVTIPGNSTVTWTLPESFTRYDSRLLQYGVAYIRVSGESGIRGPFGFRKIDI